LNVDLERGVAGLVRFDDDSAVVVIAVHLKCCGHAGSDEDAKRIGEANQIVAALNRIRRGDFGEIVADSPVVVLGDYNLVGSREPLTIIESADMVPVKLRSPIDGSAVTWRGIRPTESFWPGRLDWATVSEGVDIRGGWVIDQRALGPDTEPFSDHGMLLVDLSI